MAGASESNNPVGPPDAWAVWGAWQGPSEQVAAIARQVEDQLGANAECLVDIEVDGGHQRIRADHVDTDLAPRYRRSFKRMLISGSTPQGTVQAEFDNEKERTPGRGVALRVW